MKINQIRPLEAKFTEVLESIALKPKTLYFIGKLPENMVKTVGIVGARKCTPYGERVAYEAAYALAKEGVVIVSGLAYGVDSVASRAALDAGGKTIVVLGTPIDQIYPKGHMGLAREIIEKGGAIISEYGPRGGASCGGAQLEAVSVDGASLSWGCTQDDALAPGEYIQNGVRKIDHKTSFLYRNRLIAGLSDVVLITEAAERSGTLNTAAHTLDQGKELFVAPGDIGRLTSVGCNRLIAQGAHPYLGPEDILEVLFPNGVPGRKRRKRKLVFKGSKIEEAIVAEIVAGNLDGEKIIKKLALSAAEFSGAITMLEVQGVVRPLGMNNWDLRP